MMAKFSPLSEGEKVFVEALAGAIGGFAGAVAFYPLDTVKTRIQAAVERDGERRRTWVEVFIALVEKEGAAALFAGVGAKGAHAMASSFLYFLAFSSLRRRYEARTGAKIGVGANLFIAALSGCCNVLITEPLDTLSTRRQIAGGAGESKPEDASASAWRAWSPRKTAFSPVTLEGDANLRRGRLSRAVRRGDLAIRELTSLYSGIGASLLLTVNPAIQYTCFEQLRSRLLASISSRDARRGSAPGKKVVELSVGDAFVLGATSKAVATFLTYPLVRAKVLAKTTGARDAFGGPSGASASLPAVVRAVVHAEGFTGLYKGLQAQLIKTVLAAAFALTVKEKSFRAAMLVVLLANRL